MFSGAGTFDPFAPASESQLDAHFRAHGTKWPGENVCSKIRWRMYLRKMQSPERYEHGEEPRACRRCY